MVLSVSIDLESASNIIYTGLIATTPIWASTGLLQTAYLSGKRNNYLRIVAIFCVGCIISLPFTLIYTLTKQLYFKETSTFTILLPLIPIFSFYAVRLTFAGRLFSNQIIIKSYEDK